MGHYSRPLCGQLLCLRELRGWHRHLLLGGKVKRRPRIKNSGWSVSFIRALSLSLACIVRRPLITARLSVVRVPVERILQNATSTRVSVNVSLATWPLLIGSVASKVRIPQQQDSEQHLPVLLICNWFICDWLIAEEAKLGEFCETHEQCEMSDIASFCEDAIHRCTCADEYLEINNRCHSILSNS